MTRFGMGPSDFRELAELIAAIITENAAAKEQVRTLRRRFLEMRYCFREEDYPDVVTRLRELL